MKNSWAFKSFKKTLKSFKPSPQLAPIVSGGSALFLLNKVIFSNLDAEKFKWALSSIILLFLASAILYFFLRKLEKDKDVYLLSVIGRTVGDVFKRYGLQMAKSNADHAKAEDMNKIMLTIVNLVKSMKNLGDKKYKD